MKKSQHILLMLCLLFFVNFLRYNYPTIPYWYSGNLLHLLSGVGVGGGGGVYVRAAKRMEKGRLKPPISNIKKLPTPLSNIHKQGVSFYPLISICCPVTNLKFL